MPSGPETRDRAVRAIAIASRLFEQVCQDTGLSLPQYRLLLWVRAGPRRAAELAERIAVRRPTVTALVDGLSEQGYLQRRPVEGDRRGIKLELTDAGLAALDETESRLGRLLDDVAKAGDRRRLLDGLDELATVLEVELERRGTLPRR
jgi:DNA-binding MarR family transcriptional regulator